MSNSIFLIERSIDTPTETTNNNNAHQPLFRVRPNEITTAIDRAVTDRLNDTKCRSQGTGKKKIEAVISGQPGNVDRGMIRYEEAGGGGTALGTRSSVVVVVVVMRRTVRSCYVGRLV